MADIISDMLTEVASEQKKESLADDACEKILSLIIGEHLHLAKVQNEEKEVMV